MKNRPSGGPRNPVQEDESGVRRKKTCSRGCKMDFQAGCQLEARAPALPRPHERGFASAGSLRDRISKRTHLGNKIFFFFFLFLFFFLLVVYINVSIMLKEVVMSQCEEGPKNRISQKQSIISKRSAEARADWLKAAATASLLHDPQRSST